MKFFETFFLAFQKLIYLEILGLNLFEWVLFFIIILIAFLLREIFARFIVSRIQRIVIRTLNKTDDLVFNSLESPFKILPLIVAIIILILNLDNETNLYVIIEKINQSLFTIFIFWIAHNSFVIFSKTLKKLEIILSKGLTIWLLNIIKFLIIFLGIVAVLEIWGIKIGPIIAGLGLFGVAVALGAQDLFKNLISGILLLLEKKFQIDDVVEIPNFGVGTIEHIGFRSTTIRKFDTTPISIPNHLMADNAISNHSNRKYRRINWIIGLKYNSTVEQLKNITNDIFNHIKASDDFYKDNEGCKSFVRLERFNESSIDILVYCFANTNNWDKYLEIKENLAFNIKTIIESKHNASFAFPSQSIYLEKNT